MGKQGHTGGKTVQLEVYIGYVHRGLSNEISIRMCILNTQILVSKHNFQLIGSMNLWKKMPASRRGQAKYKMSMENLIMPESEEVLRKQCRQK